MAQAGCGDDGEQKKARVLKDLYERTDAVSLILNDIESGQTMMYPSLQMMISYSLTSFISPTSLIA